MSNPDTSIGCLKENECTYIFAAPVGTTLNMGGKLMKEIT